MEVFEQVELGAINDKSTDLTKVLFNNIYKLVNNEYDELTDVTIKAKKLYSSVCFFSFPRSRIKFVYKKLCLEIPSQFKESAANFGVAYNPLSGGYIRIIVPLAIISEGLKCLLLDMYEHYFWKNSKERFDCCSSYMECSDQKKCIHLDDAKFSASCRYNKTMSKEGKIFYGKNRNVK